MNLIDAILLGIVEGLTEFLPVSSTGHLTIVESLLGLPVADAGVTAFTAVIQVGAIVALIVFFRHDIVSLTTAWVRGLLYRQERHQTDYKLAWYIILGSLPVGMVGLLGRHLIAGPLRNLWFVVAGLVVWSGVMYAAERVGRQSRGLTDLTAVDTAVIGIMQCFALVPGISRSGATISAGLFRNLDRVSATRVSFFLSIPALVAAGAYERLTAASQITATVGWVPTVVATGVSFAVAYAAIAWLLRLVAHHPITVFVGYRLALAALVSVGLLTGVINPR